MTGIFAPGELIFQLRQFASRTNHQFRADDLSFRDDRIFTLDQMHTSRQLTDIYLLALAAKHGGRLATFDRAIPLSAVRIAQAANLCAL